MKAGEPRQSASQPACARKARLARDNEDKLGDNVKMSLQSELPVKTSHILVMDRVEESVDENDVLKQWPARRVHSLELLRPIANVACLLARPAYARDWGVNVASHAHPSR